MPYKSGRVLIHLTALILLRSLYIVKTKEQVKKVVDGDTIDTNKGRIRLLGIDAPELKTKAGNKSQKGHASKQFLENLLRDKQVEVDSKGKDRYGRRLANLRIPDEKTTINQKMVNKGHAKSQKK
jgi:endonuclease YncB( thermonuclease family)